MTVLGNEAQIAAAIISPQAMSAIVAGIVSVVVGTITALLTMLSTERRLKSEFGLDFAAERVAHELLRSEWPLRSLNVIKVHLGGFEDDELRKVLVRAGAVRFVSKSGIELWGLLERNRHRLGRTKLDEDPINSPLLPDWIPPLRPMRGEP